MTFVLDPFGIPRFAWGNPDYNTYLLYQADAEGNHWQSAAAANVGGRFVPFAMSVDGREVFADYSSNGGPASLVRSNLAGTERKVLASDDFGSVGEEIGRASGRGRGCQEV